MHQALRRVAASRLLRAAAVLLLLYTLGGFMLAPYLIECYLPRYAEQHLGQRATVSAVRINPFLLTVEASGFQLKGSGASSMLAFKRLLVDFELSSIVRRAWTFGDVQIEDLDLRLEIDSEGRLNLVELMGHLRDPEKEREGPPPLVIEHLAVSDSRATLVDLSGETSASVTFAPVNLELANISTLPDNEGHYTLAASLPSGGSLAWKGNVSLQPLASSGEISIRRVKLSTVWQFLRDELSVTEPGGELVLAGRYDFVYEQSKPALGMSRLQAEVSGLSLAPAAGAPALLALRTIRISDARFALANRELVVPRLQLSDGELSASVSDDGTLDWQRLVVRENSGKSHDENQPPRAQPWRVRLESIGIEKVALTYTDRSTMPALVVHAETLNGGLMLDATAGAGPPHVVAEDIRVAVTGTVLAAPESDTPLATLDSFVLTGGRVDMRARSVLAQTAAMSDGGVKIARGRDGPTGLLHALLSASPESTVAARPSAGKPAAGASPWQYRIDAVELKRFEVDLADHSFKPAITYNIDVVSAALTHINSASAAPIAFKTELRIGERGTVNSSGTLRQDFRQARARVDAASVAMEPLRPLLAQYALLDFKSGNLSASAHVNYRPDGKTAFTARGAASVQDFRLNEADTGDRLLSWKTLSAESIVLSLSPKSARDQGGGRARTGHENHDCQGPNHQPHTSVEEQSLSWGSKRAIIGTAGNQIRGRPRHTVLSRRGGQDSSRGRYA